MARSKAAIRKALDETVSRFKSELWDLIEEYIAADDAHIEKRTAAVKGDRRKIPMEAQPFGLLIFRVDGGNPIEVVVDTDGELPEGEQVVAYAPEHLFPK